MKNTKLKTLIVSVVAVCSTAVLIVNAGDMKTGSSDAMGKPMAAQGQGDMGMNKEMDKSMQGGMENKMHGDADMSAMKKKDMEKEAMAMESEKSKKGSMDRGMDKPMKKAME
jgi:hypothetical protein